MASSFLYNLIFSLILFSSSNLVNSKFSDSILNGGLVGSSGEEGVLPVGSRTASGAVVLELLALRRVAGREHLHQVEVQLHGVEAAEDLV